MRARNSGSVIVAILIVTIVTLLMAAKARQDTSAEIYTTIDSYTDNKRR